MGNKMKKLILVILGFALSFCLGFFFKSIITKQSDMTSNMDNPNGNSTIKKNENMKLGAFSISLSVKDINASKEFYEKLGFTIFAGGMEKHYLIMKNENALIGLFHGMFENNILTFNPGWDENAKNKETFDDVREIQRQLKIKGIKIENEADENTSGPASFMISDPDGNTIYIDQHR